MLVYDVDILIRAVLGSRVLRLLRRYAGQVEFMAPGSFGGAEDPGGSGDPDRRHRLLQLQQGNMDDTNRVELYLATTAKHEA